MNTWESCLRFELVLMFVLVRFGCFHLGVCFKNSGVLLIFLCFMFRFMFRAGVTLGVILYIIYYIIHTHILYLTISYTILFLLFLSHLSSFPSNPFLSSSLLFQSSLPFSHLLSFPLPLPILIFFPLHNIPIHSFLSSLPLLSYLFSSSSLSFKVYVSVLRYPYLYSHPVFTPHVLSEWMVEVCEF